MGLVSHCIVYCNVMNQNSLTESTVLRDRYNAYYGQGSGSNLVAK